MTKKVIKWEKWVDPFSQESDSSTDDDYMDSYEKLESGNKKNTYSGPTLIGPMGVVPINEGAKPSKIYNFWMLHSNFNISKPVIKILKECVGVESLDVFTRYRARIGIGKVFNDERVRNKITKMLCQEKKEQPTPVTISPLDMLKKQMSEKYKFWAIAITTTNEYKLFGGDTQEFVQTKVLENEYVKVHKSWE